MNLMIVNPGQTVQVKHEYHIQISIVSNDLVIANNGNDRNENGNRKENDKKGNRNDGNGNGNGNDRNGNGNGNDRNENGNRNENDRNGNGMNGNRVAQRSGRRQRIRFTRQQDIFFRRIIQTFYSLSVSDMRDIALAILNGNGNNYLEQIRRRFPDTEVPTVYNEQMDHIYGYLYNRCMR